MLTWEDSIGPQHRAPAFHLQFRTVTRDKGRDDPDDFSGIGLGGLALMLTFIVLSHPWQSLKELLRVVRRLGRWALRLAMVPVALVATIVLVAAIELWCQRDRHPTFEDYLHGRDEE
ncbi:hypothetical protein [Microtetraspora malaysiensis]|uniref:hypothetical protein n=1 Tax=Microtetraspora malaysiensis TaxID=161358 RepID=UPI0012F9033A|nr:hypothetical protein [Microtetraspora malaysiensis]